MKTKKNLCGESLLKRCKTEFLKIKDHRKTCEISLSDALMSGLAVFKLKMPSLLQFDKENKDEAILTNIKNIFYVDRVPSDTQLRAILDPVNPLKINSAFKSIYRLLKDEKVLNNFKYHIPDAGEYLIKAVDGTGYFHSNSIRCPSCLVKKVIGKDEEEGLCYHHQMLGIGIVHPNKKTVLPLFPEAITNSDGQAKNDCERNAAKRAWYRIKDDHPGLPFLVVGDALYSTVPNLKIIRGNGWDAIFGVKEKGNKALFTQVNDKQKQGKLNTHQVVDEIGDKIKKKRTRSYRYCNNLFLTDGSSLEVNFLDFEEIIECINQKGEQKKKRVHFSWMTTIKITNDNVYKLMKAGRCRWKEENEVFNTLKNKGYNLEHNYGHGKENLNVNFASLMYLAFLIDQIEEETCELFQQSYEKLFTKTNLWEKIRSVFNFFEIENWTQILQAILSKNRIKFSNYINTC